MYYARNRSIVRVSVVLKQFMHLKYSMYISSDAWHTFEEALK
jgi:hypothetical protein